MRILLIDVNCGTSSTGKIVCGLYDTLRAEGDEAGICYGRGKRVRGENILKFGIDGETVLHAALTRLTGRTGCFSFFSTRRLLRAIARFNPDVVHIHELHAYFVNPAPVIRYLRRRGIPVVWTFHCEFMYTGKCGYAYECEGYREACGHCPHLRDYPGSLLLDRTAAMLKEKKRLFDGWDRLSLAAPSGWLAGRVSTSFLSDRPVSVVHNGVDTALFAPLPEDRRRELRRELSVPDGARLILSVAPGIMSERKGGEYVLRLAGAMSGEPFFFLLVGAENPDVPHGENARILPPVSDQRRLAELYAVADLFVICSKRENFPTTCIEAQCCGTEIAGFDTGGTVETSLSGRSRFCGFGETDALASILREAAANPFPREKLRELALGAYSFSAMTAGYRALYDNHRKDGSGC